MRPDQADLVFLDIETQSAVDIRRGGLAYANHPSTRVLCAVARYDGETKIWIPPNRAPLNIEEQYEHTEHPPFPRDRVWVAHNAYGFDKLVMDRLYPNCKPVKWLDTIPLCRAARLPAALEKVSQTLFGEGKDERGKTIIETMCRARYVGDKLRYHIGTPTLWKALIEYNIRDVNLLERLYGVVSEHFTEWDILDLDQTINERGVQFDTKLLRAMLDAWNKLQHDEYEYVADLTDGGLTGTDLRSPAKVKKYLSTRGVVMESLDRTVIEEQLDDYADVDPVVIEVLKARYAVSRASKGKVERLLELESLSDSRLRNAYVYHGAHTGRWSSRGVQIHNLARTADPVRLDKILDYYDTTGELVLRENPADTLTDLMRPVFCAAPGKSLIIGDYSQIESRSLAWLTDEKEQLRTFADPTRDAYCEMATRIFGRAITKLDKPERQVGKVVVLAAIYQMSGPRLDVYCKRAKPKVDLKSLNLDPKNVITAFRESAPNIREFWGTIERICIETTRDGKYRIFGAGLHSTKLRVFTREGHLIIELPSHRELIYRNARVEDIVPAFVKLYNMTPFTKPTITYDHHHGYRRSLYGGLLTENINQAICSDIFRDGLKRCEAAGLPVVLHTHDEIVPEVISELSLDAKMELESIMSTPPDWCASLPLRCEVHVSNRYNK